MGTTTVVRNTPLATRLRALGSGHRGDYAALAKLVAGWALALVTPRALDRRLVQGFLRTPLGARAPWRRYVATRMDELTGGRIPADELEHRALEYCRMTRELAWTRARAFHSPHVPISTSVDGLERIHEAQELGAGVILWGMSFCGAVPVKLALQRAGIALVHLSDAKHGSPHPVSDFGVRVYAPLYARSETPFLDERLVIPEDGSLGYLRELQARLGDNRCVYMRGDLASVRQNTVMPVFGQDRPFAPGAPALSWKLGTPMLPLHVIRDAPFTYRAVLHPPIVADRENGKKAFVEDAIRQYAKVMEACALESPESWDIYQTRWLTDLGPGAADREAAGATAA